MWQGKLLHSVCWYSVSPIQNTPSLSHLDAVGPNTGSCDLARLTHKINHRPMYNLPGSFSRVVTVLHVIYPLIALRA